MKLDKIKLKKKRGFSEKLILIVIIWAITVFERGLYYAFKNYSESIWMYIIPAVSTILGTCFAFYTWKAKNENVLKIANNPNYDIEQMKEQLKQEVEQEFNSIGRNY